MMTVLIALAASLVGVAALIRVFENRFIYFPPRYPEGFESEDSDGLQTKEVWMLAEDGVRLNGKFLPVASNPKVLLWFHGNAENAGMGSEQMRAFARLGINILELDYRGYGKSEGSPDEAGLYLDSDAAYRYLVESRRFQPRDVILYGHSLGGAVAIDLGARRECGGLIVESSFTTAREMARRMFRLPFLEYVPKTRFDSLAKIRRVRAPVLIIHGTRDDVIPFSMGERLYAAAPQPKSFLPVEGAGHDDVLSVGGAKYLESLNRTIEEIAPR